jgi:hypothetical protein
MSRESEFEAELGVFHRELSAATKYLYGLLSIRTLAAKRKQIYRALDDTADIWNTIQAALQSSAFVALGRIFDQDSPHNIDKVLRLAQSDLTMFSKLAIAARKRKQSSNADDFLPEYLQSVYVPSATDFRLLRKKVGKFRGTYEQRFRDIRHRYYAHKVAATEAEISVLFKAATISELEKTMIFLNQLHEALWQLFNNGERPVLRPLKYSTRRLIARSSSASSLRSPAESIVSDVKKLMQKLTSGSNNAFNGRRAKIGARR